MKCSDGRPRSSNLTVMMIATAMLLGLLAGCRPSSPAASDTGPGQEPEASAVADRSSTQPVVEPTAAGPTNPPSGSGASPPEASPPEASPPGASPPGASPPGTSPPNGTGEERRLTPALLDRSLELGRTYLLSSQTDRGNFRYSFNMLTGEVSAQDNQVRQAGALWGLALIHQAHPTPETERGVLRGLDFFRRCTVDRPDNTSFIEYPGELEGETGTIALVALAAIEYLRVAGDDPRADAVAQQLDRYIAFLLTLRRPDHQFYRQYRWTSGAGIGIPSPYFDGESLLALVKMARYRNREDLRPLILESAESIYQAHVVRPRDSDPDSNSTKGVYQWASLAFLEIHAAGWDPDRTYARRTVELAHWMIDVHRTLERRLNAAYAHEGLASAWYLAGEIGDTPSQRKIAPVIDQAMYKFTTWQVGSPVANEFLRSHPDTVPQALGGVMNAEDDPRLRIDATQHQMHAVMLCRKYLYP